MFVYKPLVRRRLEGYIFDQQPFFQSGCRCLVYKYMYTPISKNVVGENGDYGSCRTEIARPKGTVVSIFGVQKQGVLRVALN